jgi:hypothetical protein
MTERAMEVVRQLTHSGQFIEWLSGQGGVEELEDMLVAVLTGYAERVRGAETAGCAAAVPTSWLDPLLTGPEAVLAAPPYDNRDIEVLCRAIANRIQERAKVRSGSDEGS